MVKISKKSNLVPSLLRPGLFPLCGEHLNMLMMTNQNAGRRYVLEKKFFLVRIPTCRDSVLELRHVLVLSPSVDRTPISFNIGTRKHHVSEHSSSSIRISTDFESLSKRRCILDFSL